MVLEQPRELNRYVDDTIPLTWPVRWRLIKPSLPLIVVGCVQVLEIAAFRWWLADRPFREAVPMLLAVGISLPLIFFGGLEMTIRVQQRSKRILKMGRKAVILRPARMSRLGWKFIVGWELEPMRQEPEWMRLKLRYALDRQRTNVREWSMVLTGRAQREELRTELEDLRQRGLMQAPLVEHLEPGEIARPHRTARGMIPLALAFFFLVHGASLLCAGLGGPSNASRDQDSSQFTEREKEKLGRTVLKFFSTRKEFKKFCVEAGTGMVVMAAVFYSWALRSLKRPKVN